MFCRICGKEIPNKSSFCPYCGERIENRKNKSIRNIILIILVLFLCGSCVWLFFNEFIDSEFFAKDDEVNVNLEEYETNKYVDAIIILIELSDYFAENVLDTVYPFPPSYYQNSYVLAKNALFDCMNSEEDSGVVNAYKELVKAIDDNVAQRSVSEEVKNCLADLELELKTEIAKNLNSVVLSID